MSAEWTRSVEQVAGRVGHDVTLALPDPLAGIIAARSARFGGLHRLTIVDAHGRFSFAVFGDLYPRYQLRVDHIKQAAVAHSEEMILHCLERQEVRVQLRPLASRCCTVLAGSRSTDRVPGAGAGGLPSSFAPAAGQ